MFEKIRTGDEIYIAPLQGYNRNPAFPLISTQIINQTISIIFTENIRWIGILLDFEISEAKCLNSLQATEILTARGGL